MITTYQEYLDRLELAGRSKKAFRSLLIDLGACDRGRKAVYGLTLKQAWAQCKKPSFMSWWTRRRVFLRYQFNVSSTINIELARIAGISSGIRAVRTTPYLQCDAFRRLYTWKGEPR